MSSLTGVAGVLVPLADKVPKENDVVAGWTGFAVFMFLVVAVAVLLWSFTRHLRKARVNFGVEDESTSIPVAGTEEGDRALADALLAREGSQPDRAQTDDEPPTERPTS